MNKKLILLPLSALLVFLMAGLANAQTCTFDQTATTVGTSSSYIRTTAFNLSATISGNVDAGDNVTNAELSNDLTSTLYRFNVSGDVTNVTQVSNKSVDTTPFLDTQIVTFTWTLRNVSMGTVATCTRAYITD